MLSNSIAFAFVPGFLDVREASVLDVILVLYPQGEEMIVVAARQQWRGTIMVPCSGLQRHTAHLSIL